MKNAYQVEVKSEGINIPCHMEYVVVSASPERACSTVIKRVKSQTKERVRVVQVREVHGEFVE